MSLAHLRALVPGVLALAGALGSSACSSEATSDPTPSLSPGGEVVARPASAACTTNDVPLSITFQDGHVFDQVVPVKTETGEGWLAIDTGSALTFVYGEDDVTKKYAVTIGCETFKVMRRDFEPEVFQGKPILGVLGADFFMMVPTDFDYPGRRIVRHLEGAPAGVGGYLTRPLVDLDGHFGLRANVDGTPRLLLIDVGSPHLLLVPVAGRPTDHPTKIQDASGAEVDAFVGDSSLRIGTETKTVPALRVPAWPYFEGYQKDLDPDLAGLLGLTGLGFRRIIVDAKAKALRFGPIEPIPSR